MPRLLLQPAVHNDIARIFSRIAEDNLSAALNVFDAAERAFKFLAENPGAGPAFDPPISDFPDARFWPITPYRNFLVVYRKLDDGVEILRVIHGARDLPQAIRLPP